MADKFYNVLSLCIGNSARSVMAEAILNRLGAARFAAYGAGSHPAGEINAQALELLRRLNYPRGGLRSKSWDEFATDCAPFLGFLITVCDSAAGEARPLWPGKPMTAHWGFTDPAAFVGGVPETQAHFADVYRQIKKRLDIFVHLPLALHKRLEQIGANTKVSA